MGNTIVKKVITALQKAGIRADEAYPGGRIPSLTGPVAAVRLGRVDWSVRKTAVQVMVMSPRASGGSACEAMALRTVGVLQDMNGTCTKEVCRFDEMADVFYIEITAEFFGSPGTLGWSAGPGYAISLNFQEMPYVQRFRMERSTDREITDLNQAVWNFTLEELLPPGISEPLDPEEPFCLTVSRSLGEETLDGCRWQSVRREDTIRGISQIRTGTAKSRDVTTIL